MLLPPNPLPTRFGDYRDGRASRRNHPSLKALSFVRISWR